MGTTFWEAPEVERVAIELMPEYHDHLVEAKIAYLFRSGTWTSKGQAVGGKAYKASERDRVLHGCDLLVVINSEVWNALDPDRRRALVDHELSHFLRDEDEQGNPIWQVVGHDVEDFAAVIKRHGLWNEGLELMDRAVEAYKQRSLFDREDAHNYQPSLAQVGD